LRKKNGDPAMCLGIVGRIVALNAENADLADVDVAGLVRPINIAILSDETLGPGDYILIHAGFAMEKIDEETAKCQTAALREYTGGPADPDEPQHDHDHEHDHFAHLQLTDAEEEAEEASDEDPEKAA
jgi:hydrogenase expression/formation protein HypC